VIVLANSDAPCDAAHEQSMRTREVPFGDEQLGERFVDEARSGGRELVFQESFRARIADTERELDAQATKRRTGVPLGIRAEAEIRRFPRRGELALSPSNESPPVVMPGDAGVVRRAPIPCVDVALGALEVPAQHRHTRVRVAPGRDRLDRAPVAIGGLSLSLDQLSGANLDPPMERAPEFAERPVFEGRAAAFDLRVLIEEERHLAPPSARQPQRAVRAAPVVGHEERSLFPGLHLGRAREELAARRHRRVEVERRLGPIA